MFIRFIVDVDQQDWLSVIMCIRSSRDNTHHEGESIIEESVMSALQRMARPCLSVGIGNARLERKRRSLGSR